MSKKKDQYYLYFLSLMAAKYMPLLLVMIPLSIFILSQLDDEILKMFLSPFDKDNKFCQIEMQANKRKKKRIKLHPQDKKIDESNIDLDRSVHLETD